MSRGYPQAAYGKLLRLVDRISNWMVCFGRYERTREEVIHLFSSDSRRLYTEDVFNTLAYPPGFVIQFRYREPWVDPRIQNVDGLEGSEAIIVSCPRVFQTQHQVEAEETEHCGYNYYPLRRGTIIRAKERGGAIHVYCKLGPELVKYPDKNEWDPEKALSNRTNLPNQDKRVFDSHPGSYILDLEKRPRTGEESDSNDVFISKGPDVGIPFNEIEGSPEKGWVNQEDEWVQLVEFLSEDSFFQGNLFYRLTEVQPISNTYGYLVRHPIRSLFWDRCSTENIFTDTTSGYTIDSGGQYRMDISLAFAGTPPDRARKDSMLINTSDPIDSFPDKINLGFRTDERSIILDPSSVGKANYSAMEIAVRNEEDDYIAPRLDLKFRLWPTLTRKIGVPILLIFGVLTVIVSGQVAGPISNFFTQEIPNATINESNVNLLLTIFGLTMTTIGFQLRNS